MGMDEQGNNPCYEIVLELIEVEKNDEFENLKDPRRFFFGKRRTADASDYLDEMQARFSDGDLEKLTTTEIPLEYADFGKEMNVTDHQSPASLNSNLNFFNFYSKRINYKTTTYFQFTVLPISKRVAISNDENYAKLIQDILNSLSLWLNISIDDLVVYISWAFSWFLKFYHLLVAFKAKLNALDCVP